MTEKNNISKRKLGDTLKKQLAEQEVSLSERRGMLKVCYSDHLEGLQGLQHSSVLEKKLMFMSCPAPYIPYVPLFGPSSGAFLRCWSCVQLGMEAMQR